MGLSDRGAAALGLLVVLLVLGGLACVVIIAQPGGGSKLGTSTGTASSQLNASSANASTNTSAAAEVSCRTDYEIASQAVSYYETLNGHPPKDTADLSTLIKDPLSSPYFTISIDPYLAGQVDVATKGHVSSPGDGNCSYAGESAHS